MKNRIFTIALVLCLTLVAQAARERNYIYVVDCTGSMKQDAKGGGGSVWEAAKNFLDREVSRLDEEDKITVIPFHQNVVSPMTFTGKTYDRKAVERVLDDELKNGKFTGICNAWDAGLNAVNPNDDNYLILLTDGSENVVKGDPTGTLCQKLLKWKNFPRDHAYYVMLTNDATTIKNKVEAEGKPETLHFIDATEGIPTFGDMRTKGMSDDGAIRVEAWQLTSPYDVPLEGSLKMSHPLRVVSHDKHVDATIKDGKCTDGLCTMTLESRYGKDLEKLQQALGGDEYKFEVVLEATDNIDIINTLTVIVINKPARSLHSPDFNEDTPNLGKASHYDKFLFWGANEPGSVTYDIKPLFSPTAKEQGSSATLQVAPANGEPADFTVEVNGTEASDGCFRLAAGDTATVHLRIIFNSDAKQGKRNFVIKTVTAKALDKIAETSPASKFEYPFTAKYHKAWNPLAWFLLLLLIAIAACLILWFAIIKNVIYSYIKVGSMMISEPYFSQRRIRGARRVVLTDKPQKQGALNRLFTGRIIYEVNPVWSSPVVIEASKNQVRMRPNSEYTVEPFDIPMLRQTEYTVTNETNKEKIKITFN
ncbi:MAG: VWA domain-containing protein [Muribaculaceae bacterium]|nr:VWA domain-containing protein [Muribaculaceae bacterium]